MCGVLALFNMDVPAVVAVTAFESMTHRGIEDTVYTDKGHAAIMHTRLPIVGIDPGVGEQPVHNETTDTRTWLVGEYYDFDRTRYASDTKAIADILDLNPLIQLNGMYHVIRKERNKYRIYQDRMGKKPIYWRKDIPAAASEIKALCLLGPTERNERYYEYLERGECPPPGLTPYREIYRLDPKYTYTWDGKRLKSEKPLHRYKRNESFEDALYGALEARLKADVSVAMLVSGGLDSSLLYKMAVDLGYDPYVFHIENEESEYLKHLDINPDKLYYVQYGKSSIDLDRILYFNETPMDRGSMVPQYLLGQAVKRSLPSLRCIITGDGADEIFCGYRRCQEKDTRDFDIKTELPAWHLPRLDKLMMAHTLEVRSPYLDERVMDIFEDMPWEEIKGKQPLKDLARQLKLPDAIIDRPKVPLKSPMVKEDKHSWQLTLTEKFQKLYGDGL